MTKFLDTTGVSYHLEQIIKNANEKLILISPYLRISDRIKELIQDKDRLKIDVRLVYGKNELHPDQHNWLKTLEFVRTSFCKNLHAKCYLNEKEALVTSMNLYEFSQSTNNEMGIYISKQDDVRLYDDIDKEAKRLIRISDELKVSVEKIIPKEERSSFKRSKNTKQQNGFCIRCKKQIPFDPKHPYCKECYVIWKEFGNKEYVEKYCQFCGKPNKSTLLKPVCLLCYKKISRNSK
ncbi:MAG: phospholipase D family protein [Candidatus Aenigmarchaeota archaeon]|nr:phospholipase D family protein [Candidatus Aenigmarchaeota archaeon]